MDDNDMLVNDGEYFQLGEPAAQKHKREAARSATKAAEKFIIDAISRLDARIAYYSTFESIPDAILSDTEQLGFHIAANKQTAANLRLEKEHFKSLLKGI